MKTLIIASAFAVTAFAMPAFAGPSVGSTSLQAGTFGARPPMHFIRKAAPPSYALTGRIEQDREPEYRWRVETHRIGGRADRTVFVREVVR